MQGGSIAGGEGAGFKVRFSRYSAPLENFMFCLLFVYG